MEAAASPRVCSVGLLEDNEGLGSCHGSSPLPAVRLVSPRNGLSAPVQGPRQTEYGGKWIGFTLAPERSRYSAAKASGSFSVAPG